MRFHSPGLSMKPVMCQLKYASVALFAAMVIATAPSFSCAREARNGNPFLQGYMEGKGIRGTVIIESFRQKKRYVYNAARSREAFLPASTFKIVNTLIALQERAVKDENETLKWDGRDRGVPAWNRDQNMKSAFPASCVWFYQELAKKTGNGKYLEYLGAMKYGNGKTGSRVDTFWLDGDLRISAVVQIEVLKNIYARSYRFDDRYYEILRALMVVDKNPRITVRAKTGTVSSVVPHIGWYVGYVETGEDVWFFACNLDMTRPEDALLRKEIIHTAFKEIGIVN